MTNLAGVQPIGKVSSGKFYSPTEGLSLNTPSVVGEYNEGNFNSEAYTQDYDSFFEKLLNDSTGKYIGAVPKIGQNAKWKTQQSTTGQPSFGDKAAGVLSSPVTTQIIGGIDSFSQAIGNTNRNEYENDLTYWKEQGKWWFDPDADTRPDLEQYLNAMPSSLESRSAGSEVLGIGSQTASGAAMGASMGGGVGAAIGAGVGGLIGTFQTIFGRRAARKEDEKNRERAKLAYEKALKEWTIKRLKRQAAQKEKRYEIQKAEREQRRQDNKNKDIVRAQTAGTRRQQIAQALMNAGNIKQAHQNKRMERWAA